MLSVSVRSSAFAPPKITLSPSILQRSGRVFFIVGMHALTQPVQSGFLAARSSSRVSRARPFPLAHPLACSFDPTTRTSIHRIF
jgi:hypothetical protein